MFLKLFEASRLRRATRRRLEHLKNPTDAASENELLKLLRRWRNEAGQLGHVIKRVVVAYETSRWCWLARRLPTHKIKPDRFEFTRSQLERQLIDCLRGLGDIRPNQLVENCRTWSSSSLTLNDLVMASACSAVASALRISACRYAGTSP